MKQLLLVSLIVSIFVTAPLVQGEPLMLSDQQIIQILQSRNNPGNSASELLSARSSDPSKPDDNDKDAKKLAGKLDWVRKDPMSKLYIPDGLAKSQPTGLSNAVPVSPLDFTNIISSDNGGTRRLLRSRRSAGRSPFPRQLKDDDLSPEALASNLSPRNDQPVGATYWYPHYQSLQKEDSEEEEDDDEEGRSDDWTRTDITDPVDHSEPAQRQQRYWGTRAIRSKSVKNQQFSEDPLHLPTLSGDSAATYYTTKKDDDSENDGDSPFVKIFRSTDSQDNQEVFQQPSQYGVVEEDVDDFWNQPIEANWVLPAEPSVKKNNNRRNKHQPPSNEPLPHVGKKGGDLYVPPPTDQFNFRANQQQEQQQVGSYYQSEQPVSEFPAMDAVRGLNYEQNQPQPQPQPQFQYQQYYPRQQQPAQPEYNTEYSQYQPSQPNRPQFNVEEEKQDDRYQQRPGFIADEEDDEEEDRRSSVKQHQKPSPSTGRASFRSKLHRRVAKLLPKTAQQKKKTALTSNKNVKNQRRSNNKQHLFSKSQRRDLKKKLGGKNNKKKNLRMVPRVHSSRLERMATGNGKAKNKNLKKKNKHYKA